MSEMETVDQQTHYLSLSFTMGVINTTQKNLLCSAISGQQVGNLEPN